MANPLSPLSPSKQNLRSPFGSTSFSTFKPQTPLFDNGKSFDFTPERNNNLLFNNENAPLTAQKRDSMGWAHSPGGDTFGDGDQNDFHTEEEQLEDAPPSSPFQEIARDPTSVMADFPRVNKINYDKVDEEQGEAQEDVEMMGEQAQPVQSEPGNFDFGNDSLQVNPAELGEEKAPAMDPEASVIHHERHYQPKQTGLRKVSNMTVSNEGMSAVFHESTGSSAEDATGNDARQTYDVGDESCLSTFSAVPNADMTLFAKLRADSPAKRLRESLSPRKIARPLHLRDSSILNTPGSVRSYIRDNADMDPPPTTSPRRKYPRIDDSLNLLDFTDQVDCPTQTFRTNGGDNVFGSPSRRSARGSPMRRSPVKMNLLDFDIPPAPTPRSIPSITPRELETLKSSFMSQISSLKATLSGRDAEVASLKEAVTDAERRVGEAMEEVRNEAARRETLEAEQREWERRGKEMESVLRGIKSEIVEREVEKDLLAKRADEAEKAKETLEGRIVELESQLSAARESAANATNGSASSTNNDAKPSEDAAKEVQDAVEKVARELHGLYKSKHETKVAALKKSYEARWEKRVREAENKLKVAIEENERVKSELETALSNASLGMPPAGDTTILRETEELEAQKKMLEAKVKGLEQELIAVKQDSEALREQLKVERAEKGELVAVVDEWLAMQQDLTEQQLQEEEQRLESQPQAQTQPPTQIQRTPSLEPPTPRQPQNPDDELPRKQESRKRPSMGPASGPPGVSGIPGAPSNLPTSNLRPRIAPGVTPKVPRFAMPGSHVKRSNSGNEKSNIGRIPGPGRSGIMSSIERMGRGGN